MIDSPLSLWGDARLFAPARLYAMLGALLLVVAVAIGASIRRRRRLDRLFHGDTRHTALPNLSPAHQRLRFASTALALLFLSIALAQPQGCSIQETVKSYGIDVVLAIDASRSMLAKDTQGGTLNRLDVAKGELSRLIDTLHGNRIGIVTFAGDAFTQCPLTSDAAAAKLFLKAIDVANMPVQGTNVARALEESKDLLLHADHGATTRVIVLLTDGEETTGSGLEAQLDALKEEGIRVLTIGIGSTTGEPIPEYGKRGNFVGYKKDRAGNTVMTRLDEPGLRQVAERTGGRYLHGRFGQVAQAVRAELDTFEKSEFESRHAIRYEELFAYAAFPGAVLLLLGMLVRPGRRSGGVR